MEGQEGTPGSMPSESARNWAILAHLGPIAASLISGGSMGWLVPLVVWLTQKQSSPFAAEHALESLNFRITVLIAYAVTWALWMFTCLIIPFPVVVWLAEIVLGIVAAVKASEGQPYRYPLTLRLIS
jgi:uncharacterized Tic20 family protein